MSFLNKITESPVGPQSPAIAAGLMTQLPAVFEYLSCDRYPDGSPRERSTMTVFVEDGVVKVCLSDRDQGRTLWRSARSLEDVLLAMELSLQDGSGDWRKAGTGKGWAGKKK